MTDDKHKPPEIIEGRLELLRRLALQAAAGAELEPLLTEALKEALALYGVEAGAITLLNKDGEVEWSTVVGDERHAAQLGELEKNLLNSMRVVHRVRSLYMTIDRDGPAGVFSYPLKVESEVYGAISGLARGDRNLAVEEDFISATAALMALATERRKRTAAQPEGDVVKKARAEAIKDTAVTINHQINNPLTAISGNLQILLSRSEELALSPDVVRLLKKIEEGAERILEVTAKLRNLNVDRTVQYLGDTKMIDLDATPDSDDEENL